MLERFFQDADRTLYPKFLIIEMNWKYYPEEARKAGDLLKNAGYRTQWHSNVNYIMTLS